VKTHLIFCCSWKCAEKEMHDLLNSVSEGQHVVRYSDTIFVDNDRYIFMVDINRSPERICGLIAESFRTCPEYELDPEIVSYFRTHHRRLKMCVVGVME